ncbi:MAG: hypothetical protein WDZ84_11590 [Rhodovibrionaceae bacterium]
MSGPRSLLLLVLAAALLAAPLAEAVETPESGVTLNVRVYRNPGGHEVAFKRDLDKANLLALKIEVRNDSAREIIVRRTDMTLGLSSGREIGSISAKQAALRADEGADVGGVMAGVFFFGYTGAVIAGHAEDSARRAQISDYDAREFKDIALAPAESFDGYVFFHLASGPASAQGGELRVWLVDSESGALAAVAVPLKDVGGAPVATPEPESRLLSEAGRDVTKNQANRAPPEPQVEVIGTLSSVTIPAPDPATVQQPADTANIVETTPMSGTPLSAPAYVEPVEEDGDELEGSSEPLAGTSTRP